MDTSDVKRFVAGLSDLSTLPVMLGKILTAARDVNAPAEELYRLISFDQALAQRVLRVANSAAFGHSGQIKDIDQAVLFLGYDRIKTIAIGMTAISLFPSRGSFTVGNLWIHGYEVGFLASVLSSLTSMTRPGECFLGGLLHDVGRIVLYFMDRARFEEIETKAGMLEKESQLFGCTHAEAGAWFAQSIGLPHEVIAVIEAHHRPSAAQEMRDIVSIVALAEALSRRLSPRSEDDGIWTAEHDAILLEFSLTEHDIESAGERLDAAQDEIRSIFSAP